MTTPILGMTEWAENQNQPHVPVNTMFRTLEVFASVVIVVEMKDGPDGSPVEQEGMAFIVDAGVDDWAGHENEIAYYSNGLKFIAPREGMIAFVTTTQQILQFSEVLSPAGWGPPEWALPVGESPDAPEGIPYDLASFVTGAPTASQVVMRYVASRTLSFAATLPLSVGRAGTSATAQTDFTLAKNGVSIGTMRFAAAGTVASFIFAGDVTFVAGDLFTVTAPVSPDATLANVAFTIVGER